MHVKRAAATTSAIEVLDHVLDKGIVVDSWMSVSVVGLSLVTVEARIVVASIETYVNHAEPVARTHAVAWLK